ncbi:MAG: tetratricopeptide repeat protein [Burkholderiales bacterium]
MSDPSVSTFLFTDIEGSTRLWERDAARMQDALARHDALARRLVAGHRGEFVKSTGDGVHAVFGDPLDGLLTAVAFLEALADPAATGGLPLAVRCGLHAGVDGRRDNDFYGNAVNRAARIMTAAHGGQILVSQTVETLVRERLPEPLALRDLGAVRLRGLAQPERVYQVVHPALRQAFPALRMLQDTPHNLPQPLTSFVGREHELAEVRRQLAGTRLLTLVGIGGLGKSRLSLAVADSVLGEYPDGVWFVELAPVTDARLVPQAIASVLGVKEESGHPVRDALRDFVRERTLLVVLDNCEHLVQACAEAARDLLEAGDGVRILASSRERLNLRGERTWSLAPLAAASPQQHLPPDAITGFPAVRLFVERAAAAQSGFAVTADNAAAIVDICHRLDGIPLAIELAAARVRAMTVQAIADRLTDRFRLLRGGDRTAPARQQTLGALIEWSYDLLEPVEQALFRRLSVFAGGFTLDAAEAVCAGGDIAADDVFDLVASLIEKSLVTLDPARGRYGMLETVRLYSQARLRAAGESDETRARHCRHFVAFAELARARASGREQAVWLARLDSEFENLQAAHRACDDIADGAALGLRLVRAVRSYCLNRGLLEIGLAATAEALAREGAQAPDLARCRALTDAGQLATQMGRHDEALQFLDAALAIARALGDTRRIEATLQPLAQARMGQGDFAAARANVEEAIALATALGEEREVVAAQSLLAQIHRAAGDLALAIPLCEEVLAGTRRLDDPESVAAALVNLAMATVARGDAEAAVPFLVECHAIVTDLGARALGQSLLEAAVGLAVHRGDMPRAATLHGAVKTLAAASGLARDMADERYLAEHLAQARAALAPPAFAEAEAAGAALGFEAALAGLRPWLEAGPA